MVFIHLSHIRFDPTTRILFSLFIFVSLSKLNSKPSEKNPIDRRQTRQRMASPYFPLPKSNEGNIRNDDAVRRYNNSISGGKTSGNPNTSSSTQIDYTVYQLLLHEIIDTLRHSKLRADKRRRNHELKLQSLQQIENSLPKLNLEESGNQDIMGNEEQEEQEEEQQQTCSIFTQEGEQNFYSNEMFNETLKAVGYNVGYRIVEKVFSRKILPRIPQVTQEKMEIELMKLICKDLWEELFGKQANRLRTDHKGVFVLQDNEFKWLEHYHSDNDATRQAIALALNFPCGVLKGALDALGFPATVQAEQDSPGPIHYVQFKIILLK